MAEYMQVGYAHPVKFMVPVEHVNKIPGWEDKAWEDFKGAYECVHVCKNKIVRVYAHTHYRNPGLALTAYAYVKSHAYTDLYIDEITELTRMSDDLREAAEFMEKVRRGSDFSV